MVLFSKVMQMIIIGGFSFLHICIDIYLYLVLVETEGSINNHMFQYVLCFTTLKFISVLPSYLAQNQNEKQKPKKTAGSVRWSAINYDLAPFSFRTVSLPL